MLSGASFIRPLVLQRVGVLLVITMSSRHHMNLSVLRFIILLTKYFVELYVFHLLGKKIRFVKYKASIHRRSDWSKPSLNW
jgi:hypothetical protein